jgi:hypothetical protein
VALRGVEVRVVGTDAVTDSDDSATKSRFETPKRHQLRPVVRTPRTRSGIRLALRLLNAPKPVIPRSWIEGLAISFECEVGEQRLHVVASSAVELVQEQRHGLEGLPLVDRRHFVVS